MYKIILVDDEYWILRGLQERLDWYGLGFEIVAALTDSAAALEFCRNCMPDVAIVDINMPIMDGIKLTEELLALNPDLRVIVLTGYSSFGYAQQALRLGVKDYLLKPVNNVELLRVITQLREELDRADISAADSSFGAFEGFLVTWQAENPQRKLGYILSAGSRRDRFLSFDRIWNTYKPLVRDGFTYVCFVFPLEEAGRFLGRLRAFRPPPPLGISAVAENPAELENALEQSRIACCSRLFFQNAGPEFFREDDTEFLKSLLEQARECLEQGERAGFFTILSSVEEYCQASALTIRAVETVYNGVIDLLIDHQDGAAKNRARLLRRMTYRQIVGEYSDTADLFAALGRAARGVLETEGAAHTGSGRAEVAVMKEYIQNHFRDSITLNSLSRRFHLEQSYISRIFKEEMGKNFTVFLTCCRIDYACKLLKTTDIPVGQIGGFCGYGEYSYFKKVFKKTLGITPREYRSRHRVPESAQFE